MQMCPNCSQDNLDSIPTCARCGETLRGLLGRHTLLENRYRLLQVLGCGGMGAVYLADDMRIPGRQVAVKENLNITYQAQSQFQHEVGLMVGLDHPGLPKVSDRFAGPGGRQYLVMDYIEGETLEDVMARRGRLPEAEVVALAEQLLDVLGYLHSYTIVHRDVKPANVKLRPDGRPVLVDFGIAKLYAPGHGTRTWAQGVGSPGFAPIEQYGRGTDARSDLYSLGAVMYYLLTGQAPPEAPDLAAGTGRLAPLHHVRPDVSPHLRGVVLKAMALNPAQRYQSAAEMCQALRGMPARARGAPPVSRSLPWMAMGGLGGLACLILAGIALVWTLASGPWRAGTPTPLAVHTPAAPSGPAGDATPTRERVTVELVPSHTPAPTLLDEAPPSEPPTATPAPEPTATSTQTASEMVRIPAGSFYQGSTDAQLGEAYQSCMQSELREKVAILCVRSGLEDESPQHEVYLDEFYIDKYEVTVAQYAACVDAGGCNPPTKTSSNTHYFYFGDDRYEAYPVIYVTWFDADRYCRWASKRLPTEAEWEKAARGVDGRMWPWGDSFSGERLNFRGAGVAPDTTDTAQASSHPEGASPYGVLNMAGNVWEWVADAYEKDYYARAANRNPTGPASGDKRVIRGGSWNSNVGSARAASRAGAEPGQSYFDVGFRCAR